jgi:hypothetical protein
MFFRAPPTFPSTYGPYFEKRNEGAKGKTSTTLAQAGGVWSSPFIAAKNFIGKLGKILTGTTDKHLRKVAESYKKLLLDTLESQRYRTQWKPLSERYLHWKIKNKRDPRMLISTREYMSAIEIREEKHDSKIVWIIGLPDRIHVDSGLPFRKLARIHEFGTLPSKKHPGIPPRPLWRPTQHEFRKVYAPRFLKRIGADIRSEVKDLTRVFTKDQPDYRPNYHPMA